VLITCNSSIYLKRKFFPGIGHPYLVILGIPVSGCLQYQMSSCVKGKMRPYICVNIICICIFIIVNYSLFRKKNLMWNGADELVTDKRWLVSNRKCEFVAQSRSSHGLDLAYALLCAVIYCAGVRAFSQTVSRQANATVDCLLWEPSRAEGHKIGTI
jgi:hypothetical protein